VTVGFSKGEEAEGGHGDDKACLELHGYGRLAVPWLLKVFVKVMKKTMLMIEEAEEKFEGCWKIFYVDSGSKGGGFMVDYKSIFRHFHIPSSQSRELQPKTLNLHSSK
jgi:hypothetical protein